MASIRLITSLTILWCSILAVMAQDSSSSLPSGYSVISVQVPTTAISVVNVPTTLSTVLLQTDSTSRRGATPTSVETLLPTTLQATTTITEVTVPSATITPQPTSLETTVDPGFGVLGTLLVLTGLPTAFWGHKNRWSSFFLLGFYSLSLVCFVLIARFGIIPSVNPPNKKLRGLFVLATFVAGVAGGGISIFFWKATRFLIGAFGGLAFGFYLQCFHNGGVIKPVGYRWLMYCACAAVGFVLCSIDKLHYPILLVSTAFVGATAFMLGVDCFTTAGLKEFYVYNLGFRKLFPKLASREFTVSQTMQLELGLIAAVAIAGGAIQLRLWQVLRRKLKELAEESRRREEEMERSAAKKFEAAQQDRELWEKEHGKGADAKSPLAGDGRPSSQLSWVGGKHERGASSAFSSDLDGVTVLPHTPASEDPSKSKRNSEFLPDLELGTGEDLSGGIQLSSDAELTRRSRVDDNPELQEKIRLLKEIQDVRKHIDTLRESRAISPAPSIPLATATPETPPPPRPPRSGNPAARERVRSFDAAYTLPLGTRISDHRPPPPEEDEWDDYLRERKVYTPQPGNMPRIPDTPPPKATPITMSPAVEEAIAQRRRRESMLEAGEMKALTSDDPSPPSARNSRGLQLRLHPWQRESKPEQPPVTILPPSHSREASGSSSRPTPRPGPLTPSTPPQRTFEELTQRHKQKLKALQDPVTKAEVEEARLQEARRRWDKSVAVERKVMEKKLAPEAQAQRSLEEEDTPSTRPTKEFGHRRNSSARVLEWQKQQVETPREPGHKRRHSNSPGNVPSPSPPANRTQFGAQDRKGQSAGRPSLDQWNRYSIPGSQRPPPN